MNEGELKNKERLALELNMKFDEAVELFSDETLNSMRMEKVLGGDNDHNYVICLNIKCSGCTNCSCVNSGAQCPENGIVCVTASLEMPSLNKPTVASPSSPPLLSL